MSLKAVVTQVLCKTPDGRGRRAVLEILINTRAIAKLITTDQTHQIPSQLQTGQDLGMQLLDDHLWTLYTQGIISADEMIDKGRDPGELTEKVHRAGGTVGRTELDLEEEG